MKDLCTLQPISQSRFDLCGLQIPTLCTSGSSIPKLFNERAHPLPQLAPSLHSFTNQFVLATFPVTMVEKLRILLVDIIRKLEANVCVVSAVSCRAPSRITTRIMVSLVRMHFPAHLLYHFLTAKFPLHHMLNGICFFVRLHLCEFRFHI